MHELDGWATGLVDGARGAEAIGALGFEDKSNKQIATLRPTKTAMPIACKAIMVGNAQRDKDSRTQVATAVLSRKFSTSIIEFISP